MNAPGKNALGLQFMNELIGLLAEADGQPILLTGTGNAFSAGLNLKEVVELDLHGMEVFLQTLESLVHQLYTYPAPTVACINGHAIAGGCVLALCCDYRVSTTSPGAKIGLNEVALGLRFPPTVLNIVRARIPRRYHERILLGAQLYTPQRAREFGLVDELSDEADAVARERLKTFSTRPSEAYAATKRDVHGDVAPTDEQRSDFRETILPIWTSGPLKRSLRDLLKR